MRTHTLKSPFLLLVTLLPLAQGACVRSRAGASSSAAATPGSEGVKATPSQTTLIRSDYKEGELERLCVEAIESAHAQIDSIAKRSAFDTGFEGTMLAYENTIADLSDRALPLTFMGYVSTNPEVSAEGSACEERLNVFLVDTSTRKDLYDVLQGTLPRNAEEARLLSETLKGFEANGLKLPADQLAKVRELKTILAATESQFSTNLNNDRTTLEFSANELAGVPADYVSRLKKSADGSKLIVGTRESDSVLLANATSPDTRRKWLLAYNNRQSLQNTQLLEKAIGLRQQIAKLMGAPTWADYRIKGRMAVDAKTVTAFLGGLREKLALRNRADIQRLLEYKKELDPSATQVDAWDINFLANQVKKRDYSIDEEEIRKYFPADVVISGMFSIYSQMLGVRYTEIKDAAVWSPDVKLYQINDAADDHLIGYFYTDFVPRQGKYGHAAAFPLISGRRLADGRYSAPVASIVANLTPPTGDLPSLLSHDDVETIFHEFGHIMHQTLTRAPFASLSGSSVAQDFVEAPSQMLENWVWNTEMLQKLSGLYTDRSQKLPDALLEKMLAARDFNQGYYYTRQLMLGTLDMTYHTAQGPVDTAAEYNRLYQDMIGVAPVEGGHFAATFGHLMGGYDAGYYGYLWSLVYATDMFTRFTQEGLLNPVVGADYRREILESGNMKDALELLRNFLGRDPNSDAFLKKLHIP